MSDNGQFSDAEMFEHFEKERLLAAALSADELGDALLDDILLCVDAARHEFACDAEDDAHYRRCRGIVREVAYRLAGKREYESGHKTGTPPA